MKNCLCILQQYREEVVKCDYNYLAYNVIIVVIIISHRNDGDGRESCARSWRIDFYRRVKQKKNSLI